MMIFELELPNFSEFLPSLLWRYFLLTLDRMGIEILWQGEIWLGEKKSVDISQRDLGLIK